MQSGKPRSYSFIKILMGAALIIGLVALSIVHTDSVQAQATAKATEDQTASPEKPSATPFANFMTQLAAPTATEGTSPTLKATLVVTPTDSSSALNVSDAMATIAAQQAEIKTLQDQLAANQGDKGATLYAVVVIAIGLLLAFAVFFGLKRG